VAEKAKSLARLRLFSGILEVIVLLGLLFAFWWFWPPISVILPSNLVAAAAVYFLIIGVSLAVVDFPLAYYREICSTTPLRPLKSELWGVAY